MQVPDKLSVLGDEILPPAFRGLGYRHPIYNDDPSSELPPLPTTLTLEDERLHHNASLENSLVITDDINDKTHLDESVRTNNAYSSGITRQVRHLHNRVRLLEQELQAQNSRQLLMISIISLYLLVKGLHWMRQ